nr:MAG TPA: tail protein [Caudoviricetes sp.]
MIQVFRNNKPFFYIEDICEGSKLSRQLMDHHYIVLKFSTASPVYFEIGDSVEIADFGLFVLTSAYFPKYNETTDGYDYELQMDAYYMSWKNKVCKYRPQYGANETSFKLTTSVSVHLNVVLSNLKALNYKYHNKDFSVDYTTYNKDVFDIEKRFLVEYSSMSIYDALNTICESLDCEWWVDGSVIYLGYCEMTGQTTFEQGVNMLSMSQTESKSSYITRLYAFGSDKNIPSGYFTGSEADVTTDGVATDYLMLPNKDVDDEGYYSKNGYIENINVVKNEAQAIEGVVLFEDEYPKLSCTVSSIKTYNSTVENENGDITTATFWQVSSSDSFATKFSLSWIKQGLTLMIKFESGALMGMEFEVNFKTIERVNYFEIVANDTYGRTLPDSVMCPKIGDKFFLYNWDATKITETNLISEAQEALYVRAKNYYKKSMVDNSNFTCVLDSEKFFNFGTYNFHPMGEQVKLINPLFSETDKDGKHYRNSRIIGMELNLDIPYDSPKYIVGEKAAYSRLGQLEDKVNSITVNGQQIGGASGGGGVYVIGMNDTTPETDSNVYSARRTRNSFLSKLNPDTAQKVITFMEGLKLGKDGKRGLSGEGNAVLGDVIVDRVHDPQSTEADRTIIGAQGFDLYMGADGKSHLYIDYLTTRVKMFAAGAEIRKVSYSGGTTIFSNAGSTIVKVAYVMDANGEKVIAYKCYAAADDGTTRTMNWWRPGMMAMCQTFNVKAQTEGELANRYYWRLVVAVGQETLEDGRLYDYVVLSNVERFHGTDEVVPSYGLKLLADGTGKVLTFGGAAVAVAAASGLTSLGAVLEQDGVKMDDKENSVSRRNYAGYEPVKGGGEPGAPMAGDVIVQVGDQVKWKSRGNVIKLSTSTEDDASGTAPAIAMYYGIGRYDIVNDRQDLSKVYMWRDLTFLASPAMTYVNSDKFMLFTGDIGNSMTLSKKFTDIKVSVDDVTSKVEETNTLVGEVGTDLTTFKQTSKEFSLKVVQRSEGRYNLLTGTAFKRKEASWTGNDTYEPWITTVYQYDGINAVVIEGAKGKNRGIDFLRVKVGRNRKHTVSAMLACDGDVAYLDFGVYIVQKDAQMNDIGNNLSIYCEVAKNMSTGWNLMTETFELDARTVYADCVFIYSGEHTARIALPMLTEGSEYLGWSLSEEDCNYRGGNLLARADTLTSGDGLTVDSRFTKLLSEDDADRYGSYATLCTDIRSGAVGRIDTVTWDLSGKGVIKQGQDYMLSFMAKGDSDADAYAHIAAYLHNDGTPDVAVEICGHVINTSTPDGEALMSVSGKWQMYYVHWRVIGDSLPQAVVLRTFTGSRLFVSQLKLEVGATATEWTAESSDYVEDRSMLASLLEVGIDINSKEMTLTAERTKFRTRTGKKVAVFDEDGLNADLINVKHLWAVNKDGTNKVGYFGNYDMDACKVGSEYAPLFVGSSTAKDAPFYVTSTGAIKAVKGYIGCFEIDASYLKHGTLGETDYMCLNSSDIVFRSRDNNFDLVMGNGIFSGVGGMNEQGGVLLNLVKNWNDAYDYKQANLGMMLSVSGKMNLGHRELQNIAGSSLPNGNHALFISNGDIAGLRPMLTAATANRALSKLECVVVCRAGVTLTLPSDPEIGQYYKIIKAMANTVTMKSEGASITYWFLRKESGDIQSRTSKTAATCALDAYVQDAELFFDGTVWQCRQYGYVLG